MNSKSKIIAIAVAAALTVAAFSTANAADTTPPPSSTQYVFRLPYPCLGAPAGTCHSSDIGGTAGAGGTAGTGTGTGTGGTGDTGGTDMGGTGDGVTCSTATIFANPWTPATVPAACSVMTFQLRGVTLSLGQSDDSIVYQTGDLVRASVPVQAGAVITTQIVDFADGYGTEALFVAGQEVAVAAGGGTTATSHVDAGATLISITPGQTFDADPGLADGATATFR